MRARHPAALHTVTVRSPSTFLHCGGRKAGDLRQVGDTEHLMLRVGLHSCANEALTAGDAELISSKIRQARIRRQGTRCFQHEPILPLRQSWPWASRPPA